VAFGNETYELNNCLLLSGSSMRVVTIRSFVCSEASTVLTAAAADFFFNC
jgi:hypothetical protein